MMKSSSEHVLRLDTATLHPKAPERKSSVHLPMGAQCAICLSAICDRVSLEVCAHEFCRSCLLEWSKLSRKCPLCRCRFNSMQTTGGRLPILPLLPLLNNSNDSSSDVSNELEISSESIESTESELDENDDDLIAQLLYQYEQNGESFDCENLSQMLNQVFGHIQFEGTEFDLLF